MARHRHLAFTSFCFLLFSIHQLPAQDSCIYPPPGEAPPDMGLLRSRLLDVTRAGEPTVSAYPIARGAVAGQWKMLVILIDFPDYTWRQQADVNFPNDSLYYTPEYFQEMLFALDYFADPWSSGMRTGSMRDYYLENSYGQFEVTGVVSHWYRAENNLAYYANPDQQPNSGDEYGFGSYPHNAQRLVEEAVAAADSAIDYSLFDNDGDGWVESVFVVHAGPGAEALYTSNYDDHWNYLWSHKSAISRQDRDGVHITGYTLEPQDGTIGVFCHEFGHALGLPDLYDTDQTSEGIGEWGLMGSGGWCHENGDRTGTSPAHFTAYSKMRLGWLEPVDVEVPLTDVAIPAVETDPVAYRMWRSPSAGEEYFLLENRQRIGFDRGLTRRQKDLGLEGPAGLLIYHIDEGGHQASDDHRLIDVEEASPWFAGDSGPIVEQLDLRRDLTMYQYLNHGNRGDNGDPWPGYSRFNLDLTDFSGARDRTTFDDSSLPSARDYGGQPTGVRVTNIRLDGLDVRADLGVTLPTAVPQASSNPATFVLSASYPNPMTRSTRFVLEVPAALSTTVSEVCVYDLRGRPVKVLAKALLSAGTHDIVWDGRDENGLPVASGVYLYGASAGGWRAVRKLILIR